MVLSLVSAAPSKPVIWSSHTSPFPSPVLMSLSHSAQNVAFGWAMRIESRLKLGFGNTGIACGAVGGVGVD